MYLSTITPMGSDPKTVPLLQYFAAQTGHALRKTQHGLKSVEDPLLDAVFTCADCLLLTIRDCIVGTSKVPLTYIPVPVVIRSKAVAAVKSLFLHGRDRVPPPFHHVGAYPDGAIECSDLEADLCARHGLLVRNTFLEEKRNLLSYDAHGSAHRSASAPPTSFDRVSFDPWTSSADFVGAWTP